MITYEQIPSTLKNPLFHVEIGDPKGVGTAVKTTVLIGQRITGKGTGTNDVPVQVFSADDVAGLCGCGSVAHRMAKHYFASDKSALKVILVPVADNGSTKATKTLTFTFSSGVTLTTSGTINFLIAGQPKTVNVTAGMSLTQIGDAVTAAFGTNEAAAAAMGSDFPVTETNTAGACAFTARNAGILGNDIRIMVNYLGTAGGQALPGNLLIDDSDAYLTSGGSDVPDITAALLALAPYGIFALVEPLYTATELLEKKNEFADRWAWDVSTFGGHWSGVCKETLGDLVGSAKIDDDLKNDWHGHVAAAPRVPWDGVSLAGAYAGVCIQSLRNDPSLPCQGLPMSSLYPVRENDRLTISELETLTAAGFATLTYDASGVPVISLERATLLTSALGAPVTGGEAAQVAYTTQYLVEAMRDFCITEYARCKLVDDGAQVAEGVAAVTPKMVEGDLGNLAVAWENAALIESAAQFKAGLIVERNTTNRNRLDIFASPDLANQLRVMAVRVVPVV